MSSIYLKPLFETKKDPLTNVLKDIFKENNFALSYIGAFSIALGVAQSSNASADENIG